MKVCQILFPLTLHLTDNNFPFPDPVARDYFSESTLGVPAPDQFSGDVESLPDAILWKTLFHTKHFQISVVPDVEGVSLCGALKSASLTGPSLQRDTHPSHSLIRQIL